MNHITLVSKVEGTHQLEGKLAHEQGRHHVLLKPDAESPQVFSHKLQHEADMVTVGTLELKIIDELANVLVAQKFTVTGAKVSENLSLKDGTILAVTLRTQNFESPKSVLIFQPTCYRRSQCGPGTGKEGEEDEETKGSRLREVFDQPNCRIASVSDLAHYFILACIHITDVDWMESTRLVCVSALLNLNVAQIGHLNTGLLVGVSS